MGNSLQDLTIKNNFMFAAVMMDGENCKELLEMILKIKIAKITIYAEKTIVYNPEYKGVRLDIEAEDEFRTHYDVEMQVNRKETLLRSRYYHSQMDMELLTSGTPYEELPDTYVIFICDYDPFYRKKYQYTIAQKCEEVPDLDVSAGIHTIFLNTKGDNEDEVSQELRKFLKFVGSRMEDSEADFQDPYIKKLQDSIKKIKKDRKMGERYMMYQEMVDDSVKEGVIRSIETVLRVKKYTIDEKKLLGIRTIKKLEMLDKLLEGLLKVQKKEEVEELLENILTQKEPEIENRTEVR